MLLFGCRRSGGDVLDDTRTAGRYMGKGVRSLFGSHKISRQVNSADEFYGEEEDFIPLQDDFYTSSVGAGQTLSLDTIDSDSAIPQSRISPGDPGGPLPGIEHFRDTNSYPDLARIFRTIHFPYNSNLVKGEENYRTIQAIANYMQANPKAYLFIEGHCDERGAAAYNLSLGSRRSNAVRNLLIKEGVNMERLFTISYGKERPVAMGHDESAWKLNRRSQFSIYYH